MRRAIILTLVLALATAAGANAGAQRKRTARRAPAPKTKTITPDLTCPSVLGVGQKSGERFCDVVTSRDASTGILIDIPAHRGDAILSFDLHNRQLYSEAQVKARKAYARYTATVVIATLDGTILDRGLVRSEFRTEADIVDWIGGGAGPRGVKAVAPTGTERIIVTIPQKITKVSIVGEKLEVQRLDGTFTYSDNGRPIAAISHVSVEYRPAPTRRRPR
jgi:hypothetical protein